jgi:hypothetical protein
VTVVVSAVPPVSTRFTAGNKVVVNTTICARPTPSTSASCTSPTGGTHIVGELGTILPDAPVLADGLIWWKVDYDTNTVSPDGWSTDGFLDLYTSTKFSLSDAVQSTAILNVRGTPSATGSLLGTQASSSLGTIINAIPVFADAYWWWNVRFAAGAGSGTTGGWSIQDYLAKYTTPVTTATISANPTSVTTGQSSATGALSANTTFAISCTGVTTATSSVEVGVGTVVTGDYPWSGIIDSKRATDWRNVGVVGGIPSASWSNCTTTACNTLYGGSVSASTINAAISSAPANSVVRIPQGNFTLGGFNITKSNVVLRGAGANLTNLKISSATSGGALGLTHAINIMTGATGLGDWNTQYINQATWTGSNSVTGSYPKEATTITLSNTTGLVAGPVGIGSLIMLDQLDDTADGWPAKGDIYSCIDSAANDCSNKPSSYWNRPGRTQVQVVTVTGISGNQVTITPGLAYPNWRSDRQPGAYWNSGSPVHNTGIEDLTVDFTSTVGGVEFQNASNAWLKGTRFITTNTVRQTEVYHVLTLQSAHITIQSNYFYGPVLAYDPYNFPNSNYVYTDNESSDIVFENNICHHNVSCMIPQYASGRNVFGYNYVHDGYAGIAGIQPHSGNMMMDLFEGNNIWTFLGDITHGTHNLMTLYRNHFDGNSHNNSQTGKYAIALLSNNRFFNVIGNVIGSQSYSSYETTLSQGGASSVFNLGWKGDNSGDPVPDDPNVKRTLLRWGNWDQFTSTNDNGTNDQTGTRWVTSEVPSGIANFANPVPSTQTLPASFYLTSKPSWFGSTAFPAIGPDVSGGTAPNTASTPTGGHANKIPARVCFEGTGNDSGYSASPAVKAFNAVNCYGQ